jgi:hypothetical protein
MRRILIALSITLMVLAAGCAQDEPEVEETTEEVEESPTPSEATGSFQLQGRILDTVASARRQAGTSPSPTGSPTGSPSRTGTMSPAGEEARETAGIEQGAPGSLAIRLIEFTGEGTNCTFEEGDTMAVAYTRATTFTPADLKQNARFPQNLRETDVSVEGIVLDEENCILVAESVGPRIQGSPTPDDEQSPSPSPSPTNS